MCCVLAHGLVAFQLLPAVAFSLFGLVTLDLPMVFAILSPMAFIYALILDKVIKPKI